MSLGKANIAAPVSADVLVMIGKEGEYYVAYCPALNVSSFGKTLEEAKEYFTDAVDVFIKDVIKRGTLEKCLLELGWSLQMDKFEPPRFENSIDLNKLKETTVIRETVPLYSNAMTF